MGEFADELNEQMYSTHEDEFGRELCMKHDYPIEDGHYSCWFCIQENKKRRKIK